MTYQALDEQTVIDYIKKRPALARIFPVEAQLTAKEVGDGTAIRLGKITLTLQIT